MDLALRFIEEDVGREIAIQLKRINKVIQILHKFVIN